MSATRGIDLALAVYAAILIGWYVHSERFERPGDGGADRGVGGARPPLIAAQLDVSDRTYSKLGSLAAGCTTRLATRRRNRAVRVSELAIDFPLVGRPAERHYDVLMILLDEDGLGQRRLRDGEHGWGFDPRAVGEHFFRDPRGVHAFVAEASYGRVSLSGRVVGWIDHASPAWDPVDYVREIDRYIELALPHATLSSYEQVYVVGRANRRYSLARGLAPGDVIHSSQGTAIPGLSVIVNRPVYGQVGAEPHSSILPSRTWAHELLHAFGAPGHDLRLDCGRKPTADACRFTPYGNPFSVMGQSRFGNHPSLDTKLDLGWLEPDQLPIVERSQRLLLCPAETLDRQPKGFVIPLDPPGGILSTAVGDRYLFDRLLVEYRRPLGFDASMARLPRVTDDPASVLDGEPALAPGKDGLLVSLGYANSSVGSTLLLDVGAGRQGLQSPPGPHGSHTLDAALSMLRVGQSIALEGYGVSIHARARTRDGGVVIDVAYAEAHDDP